MATLTLRFEFRVNNTLTNATSVLLSDPTGTYGVKRNDTDAVIVADGTAMVNDSTGVYTYTFTTPTAGLSYTWVAEVLHNGGTSYFEDVEGDPNDASTVAGYYASQADLETRLGAENVAAFSNVSGDTTDAQTDRIEHALTDADREIDAMLRSNGFVAPLATTSADFASFTDIACDLAYVKLMDIRLVRFDAPNDLGREMFFKRKRALEMLVFLIRRGLDGTRLADTINNTTGRQPQGV